MSTHAIAASAPAAASSVPLAAAIPPASFSELPGNDTQPPQLVQPTATPPVIDVDMHLPSLTQLLPAAEANTAQLQRFVQTAAVQDRLTACCAQYSEIASALQAARVCRSRYVDAGNKQGGSKQLPKRLDWKIAEQVALSSQAAPDNFHHAIHTALRTVQREATDKAFDLILTGMDNHIAYLRGRSNARDFVQSAVQAFDPELQRIAADFNAQSQADPSAASQSLFAFPTRAVASYFATELLDRLNAQMLDRVTVQRREEQRVANERAEDNKSQETVLAGAHTGQTISMLAQKEVSKVVAPLQRQIAQLQRRLEQQPADRARHAPSYPRSHASSSSAAAAAHNDRRQYTAQNGTATSHHPQPHQKQRRGKRSRLHSISEEGHGSSEHHPRIVTFPDNPSPPGKRHKPIVVTVKPKNGAGGDRHPRQAEATSHQHANRQGSGSRYSDQQPATRQ